MYGNYPTGYSYIVISISRRPGRDGRAVWEEGKDTAADKKPSLLGWFLGFFWGGGFMLIENVDSLATGMYVCPSLCSILSSTHIQSQRRMKTWIHLHTRTRMHSNKTLIWRKENKIKEGNTGFECTLLTAYKGRGTCTYKLKAATLYLMTNILF